MKLCHMHFLLKVSVKWSTQIVCYTIVIEELEMTREGTQCELQSDDSKNAKNIFTETGYIGNLAKNMCYTKIIRVKKFKWFITKIINIVMEHLKYNLNLNM